MAASIIADKLTKFYDHDKTPALDNLSFTIQPGEVYGYLGANGAGKSTTIRLLMNFLQPTSGSAKILDLDVVKDSVAIKKKVGYLAGDVALYQKASGQELLDYLAALHGGVDETFRAKLENRFEAEVRKPIASLSKGNRQKIGIIQAFMHQPQVLILDEPTSGLDPLMQEAFYQTVRDAKQRGAAVLMSSHNLAEATALCDRVGIIKHGKLISEQEINESSSIGAPVFHVTFRDHSSVALAKKEPALKLLEQTDSNVVRLQATKGITAALSALSHYDIVELETGRSDLEDDFLEFYEGAAK